MNAPPTPGRETLGRLVRDTWVAWAREQPDPKPSWLTGWDDLDDGQREVDMRIGEAVAQAAIEAAPPAIIKFDSTLTEADVAEMREKFAAAVSQVARRLT